MQLHSLPKVVSPITDAIHETKHMNLLCRSTHLVIPFMDTVLLRLNLINLFDLNVIAH